MMEEYAVMRERIPVGKVQILRQGLYYRLTCRYQLPSGEMCRLIVRWAGGCENIGIPVPEGDGFSLVKKIPVKRFPISGLDFQLIPAAEDADGSDGKISAVAEAAEEKAMPESDAQSAEPVTEHDRGSTREPIYEDRPFGDLDRLENARLEIQDGMACAVFSDPGSDIQLEADRAVVGPEDIGIDGSGEDLVPDPV